MSKTDGSNGRLGNQIIRNLALSLLAKKYNLYVEYSNYNIINNKLGIELFIGKNKYKKTIKIKNRHYLKYFKNQININYNLNFMNDYFQTEEITNIIHNTIKNQKDKIINKNKYKDRYKNNNDLFLHIRLGDVTKFNIGIEYYIKCIELIDYDNIYIATDSFNHKIINKLKELYPKIILFNDNEINTIQFGSTCNNIILSHGTFSAVIGYLAFYSNVYYPNKKPDWGHLEIFVNKGFIPII